MGDKGGKKDKSRMQKQKIDKQQKKAKTKQDRQSKGSLSMSSRLGA
jgi:hypothetical protein